MRHQWLIVHCNLSFCAEAYTLTAVQERQLNGKIRLKVTIAQGNLPVSLTVWNSTSKKLLMKVASRPDVYVTMSAIDSLKHSNESQFTIVAENAVRIDKIKANVILRSIVTLLTELIPTVNTRLLQILVLRWAAKSLTWLNSIQH